MLSLTMPLKKAVSEGSELADCVFRLWVCAVDVPRYTAALQQPGGAGSFQGLDQEHELPIGSISDAVFGQVLTSADELYSLANDPISRNLAAFEDVAEPLAAEGLAAAGHSMTATTAAASSGGAAAGVISSRWPCNPTHSQATFIEFKKKSNPKASQTDRASTQLLVDTSVGWCVLEPPKAKPGRAAKRSRWVVCCNCFK
jgi:hypothetical protein